jgi:hypothetical protein
MHTSIKHPTAGIYDSGADNMGKIAKNRRISAHILINWDFLPVSPAIADFRDVDFQQ